MNLAENEVEQQLFGVKPEVMISRFHGTDLAENEALFTNKNDIGNQNHSHEYSGVVIVRGDVPVTHWGYGGHQEV